MSDETGYQGSKNYETWCTALWIDNDQGLYNEARDIVRQAEYDPSDAADALKAWIEDMVPESMNEAGLFTDLLNAAMSEIDWYEIVENYIEELKDEIPEEDEEDDA